MAGAKCPMPGNFALAPGDRQSSYSHINFLSESPSYMQYCDPSCSPGPLVASRVVRSCAHGSVFINSSTNLSNQQAFWQNGATRVAFWRLEVVWTYVAQDGLEKQDNLVLFPAAAGVVLSRRQGEKRSIEEDRAEGLKYISVSVCDELEDCQSAIDMVEKERPAIAVSRRWQGLE